MELSVKLNLSFDDWNQKNFNPKGGAGGILFQHVKCENAFFFFFFQECNPFVWKTADKYPHLPHVKICQSIWSPLISPPPLLLILRRLREDPEKSFWNGPELAVWLFGNPLLFLSLFYSLIKSALCFATFQALISGLGRVKRPRQFEKGSLRHKEAACSQSFPSSTPPRQKREGESNRVIHWRVIVRT